MIEVHTITECDVAVMTAQGPHGETMPLIELRITSHSDKKAPTHWPHLRLPLHRAEQLTEMLRQSVADARARIHIPGGPVQ